MKSALCSLLLLSTVSSAFAGPWLSSLPDAQARSKAKGRPILLDFHAPWCYSCYYMEQNVLSKPAFEGRAKDLVPVTLDVDTPQGNELQQKYHVTFLPTYVVLSPGGERELGRIIGEQTEADFLDKLAALTGGRATDDAEFMARRAKIKAGDMAELRRALADKADCRTPYAVEYGQPTVEKLPSAEKSALLVKERAALEDLAARKLFVSRDQRCADFRSGVEALASVEQELGDTAARAALLERAVGQLEADQASVGQDRNRDDNLRLFLDMSGDEAKLKTHYEGLIKAYPSDYVYPYRWAKHLVEKGRATEALPWIETADRRAYGANRLMVTDVRARALAALGRRDEARALLERDLRSARGRFPDETPLLAQTLTELNAKRASSATTSRD